MEVSGGAVYTGNLSLQNYMNTLFAKDNSSITNTYLFGISAIFIVVFMGVFISYLTVRKRSMHGRFGYAHNVPIHHPGVGIGHCISRLQQATVDPERRH